MQIRLILNENSKLGRIGDQVKVAAGYARNYLLPYRKAVLATKDNVAEFKKRRSELEKAAAEKLKTAQEKATVIESLTLTIPVRASEEGKLFGSIGPREIVAAAKKENLLLDKSQLHFPKGPIRQTGEHVLTARLHSEVSVNFTVSIIRAISFKEDNNQ
jgi:large subunit ribosomal protein L9